MSGAETGRPDSLAALRGQFPGWEAWAGVAGLLYVRRRLSSPVLVENSVTGSGLDFHAAGRYSLSSPPRPCRRRILSIRAGNGIMFGSSSGARRSIPSPWWLRPAL